jgi:phosphopantothenoylcysteine decarboxylase/phosphopantothenate--cysteine ligase
MESGSFIDDKNVILGVCGGIAAYKSAEIVRLIQEAGGRVQVVMTKNAGHFVGPITFEALSGQPVLHDLFESNGKNGSIHHIDWARTADAILIAPATANVIGKIAGGIADDALTTMMLAVTAPVLICPAMNTHMYRNVSVQRNLDRLSRDGYEILEPAAGRLACGTVGPGRMRAPTEVVDKLIECLAPSDFVGKRFLVTAGPTREPIDPVRFISNPSSGKMGFALARAARQRGAEVTLVTGPVTLPDPVDVTVIRTGTAREMANAVLNHFDTMDVVVKTAAVSDYRPKSESPRKIKKARDEMTLNLIRNQDILKTLGRKKNRQFLVGFAAETDELQKNAKKKLEEKNLDILVGNLIGSPDTGFESDNNTVSLFSRDGTVESWPSMSKDTLAHALLDRVARMLDETHDRKSNDRNN